MTLALGKLSFGFQQIVSSPKVRHHFIEILSLKQICLKFRQSNYMLITNRSSIKCRSSGLDCKREHGGRLISGLYCNWFVVIGFVTFVFSDVNIVFNQ